MIRKSESPQNCHPFTNLRSKVTLQPSTRSSQNLYDSRCDKPRFTEVRLEFKAKLTTNNPLTTSTDKLIEPKGEKQDRRQKNSPMFASYIPNRKDELIITLVLAQGPRQVKFSFTPETLMSELSSHLRSLTNMQNVIFRSGDLMVDHALTIDNQKAAVLKFSQPLKLRPQSIITDPFPENSLKRFNVLKCIGSGGFSKVFMA
jgi:hypothetical protein